MIEDADEICEDGSGGYVDGGLGGDSIGIDANPFGVGIEDGNGATGAGGTSGNGVIGFDSGLAVGSGGPGEEAIKEA